MHSRYIVKLILLAIVSLFSKASSFDWFRKTTGCPSPELLHPCTCLTTKLVVTCEELFNENVLKAVTNVSKGHGIIGMEFESIALRFIPEDAFEGLDIKILSIKDSSILALSETSRAFSGLENSLESLTVSRCPFVSSWEWSHLANLKRLKELAITESELLEIRSDFLTISHLPLTSLKFLDTKIQYIPNNAFSSFKGLTKIILDQNYLTQVNRALFPRPAKKLISLGLSHNRIRFLPSDMFQDMPALQYLYLGANPLQVLEENSFKPIWKKLTMFVLNDVPLICDCRISWLTKINNGGKFIHARCSTPFRLRGRSIQSLESEEVWCSMYSRDDDGEQLSNDSQK